MDVMAKPNKPRGGRPRKPEGEKHDKFIQIRIDAELSAALEKYHEQEGNAVRTDSIRKLLRKALKAEGLL